MKTFLIGLGSSIITKILEFLSSKTGKVVIAIPLALLLLTIIPYEIKFPDEVVNILTSDMMKNLFLSITFLFPVNFALSCLLIIFLSKHSAIFVKIAKNIFRIFGGGN